MESPLDGMEATFGAGEPAWAKETEGSAWTEGMNDRELAGAPTVAV